MSDESTLCALPSIERDPHIDHRVAGADTLLHLRPDALLHAGDELPRHRTADHLVDEFEARPLGQRLHLDVANGELAVSAGLFDVPAVSLGRAAERLPQRHPQVDLVDLTPYRFASRSSTTPACASPMHHSTI